MTSASVPKRNHPSHLIAALTLDPWVCTGSWSPVQTWGWSRTQIPLSRQWLSGWLEFSSWSSFLSAFQYLFNLRLIRLPNEICHRFWYQIFFHLLLQLQKKPHMLFRVYVQLSSSYMFELWVLSESTADACQSAKKINKHKSKHKSKHDFYTINQNMTNTCTNSFPPLLCKHRITDEDYLSRSSNRLKILVIKTGGKSHFWKPEQPKVRQSLTTGV